MENYTNLSKRDFRPSFYYNSFDFSLTKLNRTENLFEFLCSKAAPLSVKQLFNFIEVDANHTHFGLYSTNGCILISDISLKLLKDEKTVKSYIKDAVSFFEKNKFCFSSKTNETDTKSKVIKQEYPVFDRLKLVKTEYGLGLSYSFSCAVTQQLKTELNKHHFFKLYALKHKITNIKQLETQCSDFLYSILKIDHCVPHELMNRVFCLPPNELLLLKNKKLQCFTDAEYQILQAANFRYLKVGCVESKHQFVSMASWVDAVLTKNSESNLYYYSVGKLTKHIKNKFTKNKKSCKFQIRVCKVRQILQRTSKNYDNYAINKYLQEVASILTEKTDLKIGVGLATKGKGSLLSFQLMVVKKTKEEIEVSRLNASSAIKVKKVDCFTIKYHEEVQRKFKTTAFFHLDENDSIHQIEYVLFDDLIKNPKITAQPLPQSESSAKTASFAPKTTLNESVGIFGAIDSNNANNDQPSENKEIKAQILKLKSLSYKQPFFDQDNDSVCIPLDVINDIENASFRVSIFDAQHKEQKLNKEHLIEMQGSNIFIKRAMFTHVFKAAEKKSTLSINVYYKNNAVKSYRFDSTYIVRLLSNSLGYDYSSLLDRDISVCQNTVTCKSTLKNRCQLKLLIQNTQYADPISFSLLEVNKGISLFSQNSDKTHLLEIDWYFVFNVMQYAIKQKVEIKVRIKSSASETEMMLTDFINMMKTHD